MAIRKVGWGIVGTGAWADSTIAPALRGASNASFLSVAGSDLKRARAFAERHGATAAHDSVADLLEEGGIEAVWIASPHHFHARHVLAALEAGKHVLCEKPMALDAAEAREMRRVAEKRERLLSIGFHLRHHPLLRRIHADWSGGKFGKPLLVRAQIYQPLPSEPDGWQGDPKRSGGGAICGPGAHGIDLCRWFLGDPVEVRGSLSSPKFRGGNDDFAFVTMEFPGPAQGVVEASTGAAGPSRFEMVGTDAWCSVEGIAPGKAGLVTRGGRTRATSTSPIAVVDPWVEQAEAFSRAVRGQEKLRVTPRDGLKNLRVIEELR
jgi:predicted dehydrogenase